MKKYSVAIYTRSNACISPNKEVFQHILEAKSAKRAKIDTWDYFNTWFNSSCYSRSDLRIDSKHITAE